MVVPQIKWTNTSKVTWKENWVGKLGNYKIKTEHKHEREFWFEIYFNDNLVSSGVETTLDRCKMLSEIELLRHYIEQL